MKRKAPSTEPLAHTITANIQNDPFDKDRQRIVELLNLGVSIRKIALEHLKYGDPSSLHYYVQTRNLLTETQQLKATLH